MSFWFTPFLRHFGVGEQVRKPDWMRMADSLVEPCCTLIPAREKRALSINHYNTYCALSQVVIENFCIFLRSADARLRVIRNTKGTPIGVPLFVWLFNMRSVHILLFSPYLTALCRKVTICALVQVSSGENVVALVPNVMPFCTAQATAFA